MRARAVAVVKWAGRVVLALVAGALRLGARGLVRAPGAVVRAVRWMAAR